MQTITILMHMLPLMWLEIAATPIRRASDSWWGREEPTVVLVTMESVKIESDKRCPWSVLCWSVAVTDTVAGMCMKGIVSDCESWNSNHKTWEDAWCFMPCSAGAGTAQGRGRGARSCGAKESKTHVARDCLPFERVQNSDSQSFSLERGTLVKE